MSRWLFIISFFFFLILTTDISYAAGIIYRVQQMKAMKQQEQQEEYQQYQQQQGQSQNQESSVPTYQQTVDQRNQSIAQAILSARNPSVSTVNEVEGNSQTQEQISSTDVIQQQALPQAGSNDVKDVVDLSEVWKKLDNKSTVWTLLIDDQDKVMTVAEYIGRFQKQGVKINEPPVHYVQMIDQIISANPQMLQRPFGELIQIAAIVDYDFDNGMNKDDLARKALGEAAFEANKKRFNQ